MAMLHGDLHPPCWMALGFADRGRLSTRTATAASTFALLIQRGGDQGEEGLQSLAVGGAGIELESGAKQS